MRLDSSTLCLFLALIGLFWAIPARADTWAGYSDSQIASAIYLAEGGAKTRFPYGIKSIKCDTKEECRQICLNSIKNAKKRWIKAGKPEDFIVFMGRRYSPPNINPNWVRLVKFFLSK